MGGNADMISTTQDRQHAAESWLYLVPVAVSLVVNVAMLLFVTGIDRIPTDTDESEYYRLAMGLYEGGAFEGMRRTPVWPATLAAIWQLTGPSYWPGKLLNVLLGALGVLGVQRIAVFWLPPRAAAAAALITALLPTYSYLNATMYLETPATCAFIWVNVLAMRAVQRADPDGAGGFRLFWGDWLFFGAAVAGLNLIKPAYVLWPVFLVGIGAWVFRRQWRAFALTTPLAAASFCLVMAPWWIRNYELSGGHWVPFTLAGDQSLIESNNPRIAGMEPILAQYGGRTVWIGPGKFLSSWSDSDLVTQEELDALDARAGAALLRQRALDWIASNPVTWLVLVVKKLLYGFGLWPLWQGSLSTLALGLPFTLVFLFSLRGWGQLMRTGGRRLVLLAHPFAFVAVTAVFFGSWRYRSAYEPSFVIAMLCCVVRDLGKLPGLPGVARWLAGGERLA